MAYIDIKTNHPVYDGMPITFYAPCDCNGIEGVAVGKQNFLFRDVHGETLAEIGNLFVANTIVKVILDVKNGYAYIQNADTNAYLERKFAEKSDISKKHPDPAFISTKSVPSNSAPYAEVKEIGGMTRKCTNLFDIADYRRGAGTLNSDGSVTITASVVLNCATNYTGKIPSGTYTVSNLSGKLLYVQFSEEDYANGVAVGGTKTFAYDGVSYLKFLGATQYADESVTYKVMLNSGDTALPYEPYFEGLRSASTEDVESVGVNLCSPFKVHTSLSFVSITDNIRVKPNTDYALFAKQNPSLTYYTVYVKRGDNQSDIAAGQVGTDRTFVFNTGDCTEISMQINSGNDSNGNLVNAADTLEFYNNTIMLNEGSTALPYTPYRRNTLPIPESIRNIDGYGWGINADCYNYIDFEKKQFVKRVGKVVFDGTETWRMNPITVTDGVSNVCFSVLLSAARDSEAISSHFKHSNYPYAKPAGTTGIFGWNSAFNWVYFAADHSTVDEWKTYLAEQYANGTPVTVYYELAEPIITDISDILPDGAIAVEEGGTVSFVNEFGYDVPNTVDFYIGKNEVIAADVFVGDLVGTASRAVCDKDGNKIEETYLKSKDLPESMPPSSHNHTTSEITDFPTEMPPSAHSHKKSEITDFPTSMTPTAHNQAASTITAGTFAGQVVANASGQSPSVSCLRNSKLVNAETNPTVNGEICWTYK